MIDQALAFFKVETQAELVWVIIGLGAQILFSMRFIIQWIASEKQRRSVVPELFWWFSIIGGVTLLAYAVHRQDPVFILGQSLGVVIYLRNLWLIYAEKRSARQSI
ncbi:lipid-A-disaccharide synthase N-terminal domain-containing protein [Pseudodonghicola flavimaris]|uniref:Lipid-A-disaccharide synthase N-terminal domain-containing protein n=1 Tax=Pseudodonghicola flavimaris TaxID=3050036 RepID=A0ABT7EXL6_9RHOB|nr:lipid-A-disaccharide synthase N-terminal domain-containing protein [Pseudodonghicola flavimaris]MDK3017087.1 lipid-A-disaccharide synthase N-terminal domain-containing protein [Pseudodonghicola flavimaris]